ncbi:MAG: zinc-dependent alcohol dehydrogenase [Pseudomonadota bacterium]
MAKTMRAAVARAYGEPLRIEEVAVPEIGPDQILVAVEASGVCHTDVHAVEGDWPVQPPLPFIPGHEVVGRVAAAGRNVTLHKEGDRVGVPWLHSACCHCHHCETGWETLCETQRNTGYSVNGGFAEFVAADPRFVAHIPANLDPVHTAPILCAGVTTYKGLKETEVRPGEWVAIVGIGGLGHLGIRYAKAMGMKVAAIDIDPGKLQIAQAHGAELTIDASMSDSAETLQREIGGVHGALVTAVSTSAFGQGVGMLRRKGTMVLVGLPPGEFPTPIFDVVLKRLTIRGSIVGTRADLDEALAFAAEGRIGPHVHTAPLSDINRVLTELKAGHVDGRYVLDRFE